ncbi:hypothetical protein DFJ73DRAFT_241196 [Zopfochytrium polystomum]|nr:hypothetical protein DFJ73DRAFT_241196 [Zopfochytrium polystomum]
MSASRDALQMMSQLAGVIVACPSLLSNLGTMNTVLYSYKDAPQQIVNIVATLLALVNDVLILVTTVSAVLDGGWGFLGQSQVLIAAIKRTYSINTVYVTVQRLRVVAREENSPVGRDGWPSFAYVAVYAVFSAVTLGLHVAAYVDVGWAAGVAPSTDFFRLYRILNVVTTALYVFLGLAANLKLLILGDVASMNLNNNIKLHIIYNHTVEIFTYIGYLVNICWGMVNPSSVTGYIYVEQVVLSLMMLNGSSLAIIFAEDAKFTASSQDGSGRKSYSAGATATSQQSQPQIAAKQG